MATHSVKGAMPQNDLDPILFPSLRLPYHVIVARNVPYRHMLDEARNFLNYITQNKSFPLIKTKQGIGKFDIPLSALMNKVHIAALHDTETLTKDPLNRLQHAINACCKTLDDENNGGANAEKRKIIQNYLAPYAYKDPSSYQIKKNRAQFQSIKKRQEAYKQPEEDGIYFFNPLTPFNPVFVSMTFLEKDAYSAEDFPLLTRHKKEWDFNYATIGDALNEAGHYLAARIFCIPAAENKMDLLKKDMPDIRPDHIHEYVSFVSTSFDCFLPNENAYMKKMARKTLSYYFTKQASYLLNKGTHHPALPYMLEGAMSVYNPAASLQANIDTFKQTISWPTSLRRPKDPDHSHDLTELAYF